MKDWFRRQWHGYLVAFWTDRLATARHQQNLIKVDAAIDHKHAHEAALARYQGK